MNWKLYDSIVEERNESDDYPDLIDIGSCSLHVVHGAFRTGVQKSKWGIDSILQALYNLFPNSPAKREDYTKITGSKVFPLPFSGTRWIEDKKVADRALEIWPNITKYVSETRALEIWPNITKYVSETLKKPESSSNIRLLCHSQISCTG